MLRDILRSFFCLSIIAALLFSSPLLSTAAIPAAAPGEVQDPSADGDLLPVFKTEEIEIQLPSVTEPKTLLWISDLHLNLPDDPGVAFENQELLSERSFIFLGDDGLSSAQRWDYLPSYLDSMEADGLILGGDIMDYISEDNAALLKKGLDSLSTPWIYIRADHDYGRWYGDMDIKTMRALHRSVSKVKDLYQMDFGEFILVGINLNTSQIKEETLRRFEKICSAGKPVILAVHVPVRSAVDSSLEDISREGWDGRVLIWGEGCYYNPDEVTLRFLDIVMQKDGPVKLLLAGHLHRSWDGMLSESCREHVFDAAFKGCVGVIHIS